MGSCAMPRAVKRRLNAEPTNPCAPTSRIIRSQPAPRASEPGRGVLALEPFNRAAQPLAQRRRRETRHAGVEPGDGVHLVALSIRLRGIPLETALVPAELCDDLNQLADTRRHTGGDVHDLAARVG